jgi:hypothetical protein
VGVDPDARMMIAAIADSLVVGDNDVLRIVRIHCNRGLLRLVAR